MAEPSVVVQQIVIETRHASQDQIVEIFPDRVARGRAPGNEIVDAHDLVDWIDLVEQQRQFRVAGNMRLRAVQVAIDLVENIAS